MKIPNIDNDFELRAVELKSQILEEGLGDPNLIVGCTDKEILHLENKLDLLLPESYKIFLKHFGHGLGGLVMNDIDICYQDIQDLTKAIKTLVLIYDEDPKLPEKSFVFASRYNEQFMFYDCSKMPNDFTIFYHMENRKDFSNMNKSIFDVLEGEIKLVRERMVRRKNRRIRKKND